MAQRLCCSAACGIFPDQGSKPCPLHWQADSQPLRHQGSPRQQLLMGYQLVWFVLSLLEQFLQLPRGSQYKNVRKPTGDQIFDNLCFGSYAPQGKEGLQRMGWRNGAVSPREEKTQGIHCWCKSLKGCCGSEIYPGALPSQI